MLSFSLSLAKVDDDLRRSDRILGVGDGSRTREHGSERLEGRAVEGTQHEPVLRDLVAGAGCPDLAAQVRHFLDSETGLAGDHHQVRVLEDLVQLGDRFGLFRTIHGFLQLRPVLEDPDRTGCVETTAFVGGSRERRPLALLACPGSSGTDARIRMRAEIPLPPSALAGFPIRLAPERAKHLRSRTGAAPAAHRRVSGETR